MGMRTSRVAAIPLLATLAFAQNPETAAESAIKVDVDVVNVLCTVHDRHGGLVTDLNKNDFEVLEDGRRQEIRYFTRDTNAPLTVALLVDVSGSVRRFVFDEKGAVATFLTQVLRPDDRALLVGFSSTIVLWQDLTSSAALLQDALQRLRPVPLKGLPPLGFPMPSTLLYKSVQETADTKLKALAGRKVMVIISDGLDNGSPVHLDAALEAAQTANTIVYGICFESGFSGCNFLQDMSSATGGHTFRVKKLPIEKIFRIIEDETRSQYAIGYVSSNRTHDGTFRKLQVRVHPKGLKAECRKGYYAAR
jgi:VWFA-related protein